MDYRLLPAAACCCLLLPAKSPGKGSWFVVVGCCFLSFVVVWCYLLLLFAATQGRKGNPRSPTYFEETPGRTPHRWNKNPGVKESRYVTGGRGTQESPPAKGHGLLLLVVVSCCLLLFGVVCYCCLLLLAAAATASEANMPAGCCKSFSSIFFPCALPLASAGVGGSGWWFGTWILWLSVYWEFHNPNWRTHMFQRGRYTTNQYYSSWFGRMTSNI